MKNISLILQREPTECALACLAMILNMYESTVDINTLHQNFTVSLRGTSLADLIKMAHACKLSTKVYYLTISELTALPHPSVVYWNNNHYVVFAGMTQKRIKIFDPALGYQEYTLEEFANHFNGLVLTLTPANDYTPIAALPCNHLLKRLLHAIPTKNYIKQFTIIIALNKSDAMINIKQFTRCFINYIVTIKFLPKIIATRHLFFNCTHTLAMIKSLLKKIFQPRGMRR